MDLPAGPPATAEAMADDLALLEALVAHAPLGLGFWDTDLRYRRVNDALAAFNRLRPVEPLGRTPGALLGPLGEEAERMLRAVLRSGEPILAAEVTGETPAAPGQPRHWHVSFYPVEDASGARRGVAAVVEDVTEQREAEQERTRLLQEALVARERAERASRDAQEARRRSEFLAAAGARLAAMRDFEATVQETAAVGV